MDKWTSLGADGYRALIKACFKQFTLDDLDLPRDLAARGVDNHDELPGYFYRDDGLKLWNSLAKFCFKVITHFYKTDDDVREDTELAAWISVGCTVASTLGSTLIIYVLLMNVKENCDISFVERLSVLGLELRFSNRKLSLQKLNRAVLQQDIRRYGFPVDMRDKIGLPEKLNTICELSDLMTKLIFTCTCQHKATSAEALDL